jgi:hypothetical protein
MSEDTGVPPAVLRRLQLALVGFRWDPPWWTYGGIALTDEALDTLEDARNANEEEERGECADR